MAGWIILAFLVLGFMWLLWTPLWVNIDSEKGLFRAEWRRLCAIQWLPEESFDSIRVEAPFFHRTIQFSDQPKPEKRSGAVEKPAPTARKKQSSFPAKTMWRLGRNVLRSFEIKRLEIWWDSDDFIWNAQMYPLARFINRWGVGKIHINFTGQCELALYVENRLGRIIWAVLQAFITKRSRS